MAKKKSPKAKPAASGSSSERGHEVDLNAPLSVPPDVTDLDPLAGAVPIGIPIHPEYFEALEENAKRHHPQSSSNAQEDVAQSDD